MRPQTYSLRDKDSKAATLQNAVRCSDNTGAQLTVDSLR